MTDFPLQRIDELAHYLTVGFVGSMADLFTDEGVPLLRGQNIKPYSLDLSNLKFISPDTHKKWKKSSLEAGDVVIVRVGYPGTACVIPPGMGPLNAASLVIVRPNRALLDPHYLAYVLNSPWGKATINGRLVGAAQQVFNTNTAAETPIPAPSVEVQRRIASILSAYDDLIENNTRRIAILEELARRIYEEWFVRFRFPGHENVRMVESELGLVPEGWRSAALGDLVDDVRDTVSPESLAPDTPYVGLEHIPRRSIALAEWGRSADVQSTKVRFRERDILFGKIRPYFHKVAVAPLAGVASSDAIVIRPKNEDTYGLVLAIVSSDAFVAEATQTSNGTKMPRANWGVLQRYPVPIPPVALRTRFEELMAGVLSAVRNHILRNQNLRTTRDLLLPKLISGELDVSATPEPEAAAA